MRRRGASARRARRRRRRRASTASAARAVGTARRETHSHGALGARRRHACRGRGRDDERQLRAVRRDRRRCRAARRRSARRAAGGGTAPARWSHDQYCNHASTRNRLTIDARPAEIRRETGGRSRAPASAAADCNGCPPRKDGTHAQPAAGTSGSRSSARRSSCCSALVLIVSRRRGSIGENESGLVIKRFGRAAASGPHHRARRRGRLPGAHAAAGLALRPVALAYKVVKVPLVDRRSPVRSRSSSPPTARRCRPSACSAREVDVRQLPGRGGVPRQAAASAAGSSRCSPPARTGSTRRCSTS